MVDTCWVCKLPITEKLVRSNVEGVVFHLACTHQIKYEDVVAGLKAEGYL